MRQGWDSEAGNWAKFARTPGHDHAHEDINLPVLLELLPPPGPGTLDLACGEGRLSRLLKSLGHQVVGIDASPTLVQLAVTHERGGPAVLADAAQLPFRDEAFELVVAYMCLHDIDGMPEAVREVARVLAPSGWLCAAIPHPINTAGCFQDRDPAAPFVITGSYLDPAPSAMVVDRGGIRLTFHSEHRPLEAYFRALETAGLVTETIREVRPSDQVVMRDPAARRWQRIPLFLHLRASPGLAGGACRQRCHLGSTRLAPR
jgi:SAM-dependent methyltransferase